MNSNNFKNKLNEFRSDSNEVRNKVKEHILDSISLEDLKIELEDDKSIKAIGDFIDGGLYFEIYYDGARDFLNSLNLNNKSGREFSDNEVWKMYKVLLTREILKLLKTTK